MNRPSPSRRRLVCTTARVHTKAGHERRLNLEELETRLSPAQLSLPAVQPNVDPTALVVSTTADSGTGSLRAAVTEADQQTGDVITFAVTGTITLQSALPDITASMSIDGPGASVLTIARYESAPAFRIFTVDSGSVAISGLTLTGGFVTDGVETQRSGEVAGGAVSNAASLAVTDCVIDNNSLYSDTQATEGGGIANFGMMSLEGCTIIQNTVIVYPKTQSGFPPVEMGKAPGLGGGGGIFNTGSLTIDNSAIDGNQVNSFVPLILPVGGTSSGAGINSTGAVALTRSTVAGNQVTAPSDGTALGGGIAVSAGSFSISDSTIARNQAGGGVNPSAGGGGGIYDDGDLQIADSTIADNSAAVLPPNALSAGGGFFTAAGNAGPSLSDTIVAGNSAASGPDGFGAAASQGYNLIQTTSGIAFSGATALDITGVDPRLGLLEYSGGPTETMALMAGSPAIDAGNPADSGLPATDQRGLMRVYNGRVDIGAFEAQSGEGDILHPSLSAANASTVFYVTPDHALWESGNAGWTQLGAAGTVRAVSAVTDSFGNVTVFAATTDHALFEYSLLTGWQQLGASGTVWAASAGTDNSGRADAYVMLLDGGLTRWSTDGGWLVSPIGAPDTISSVTAVMVDRAYVVTTGHQAVGYDDERGWFEVGAEGYVRTLDATSDAAGIAQITTIGLDNSVVQVPDDGDNNPTPLLIAMLGGDIDAISVTPTQVFGLTTSGQLDELQSNRTEIAAGGVVQFSATSPERAYAEMSDGTVAYQDDAGGWVNLAPL